MARVPYLDPEHLEEPARSTLAGYHVNLFRALANAPAGLVELHRLGMWIRNDLSLPPRLRELAILQVGASTGNAYEFSHHVRIGMDHGLGPDDVRAVSDPTGQARDALGDLDRTVLDAAAQLAAGGGIEEATWTSLGRALDDQQLVELVVTVAFYSGVVRMISALEVDLEEPHVALLREFPLPGS